MRIKRDSQGRLAFKPSNLKVTNEHYARYGAISDILDNTPRVLHLVHEDVAKALDQENRRRGRKGRPCQYTSEHLLRIVVCQAIEGLSLREVVVRIDDSYGFRQFVRIYDDPMMDYSVLCRLRNQIRPKTWKKINRALAKSALADERIDGAKLRLDTTAVETNIHWPSDSGLLWDVYRVLARLIRAARELDAGIGRERNLQEKHAKKMHTRIAREASKKNRRQERMNRAYNALFGLVEGVLEMSVATVRELQRRVRAKCYDPVKACMAEAIVLDIEHYKPLGDRVLDQAKRRVLDAEKVPADEKLYSIFEPDTELLIRGKAGKDIEFGHMIHLQQVEEKFITDYEVFEKRPADHTIVDSAVKSHTKLFGHAPEVLAADKGFYQSMDKIDELEEDIEVVSICKKGSRTADEIARESSLAFKLGQMFRAGVEGSISFLKRVLRLARLFVKGYEHFEAEVGRIVFAHNLIVLARRN